jgi:predicted transcriptional regulator
MKKFKQILNEILKENGHYSQGRIYLFWSVLAYYVTLGLLTITGIRNKTANIDINNFTIIINALEYAMVLFAGYVFGGKMIDSIKTVAKFRYNKEEKEEENG